MMSYCTKCGSVAELVIPEGDDKEREVCTQCGFIHYSNPRMVVGCIPIWEGDILMVKRAIEPAYGKWTLPAGYLENGESVMEGARREVWEEAGVELGEMKPFGLYNLPQINQVYFMFSSQLESPHFSAGSESLEVKYFQENEIPWDEIAFKVVESTLRSYFQDFHEGKEQFHMEDIYFGQRERRRH